jgi:hypothetical protein
MLNFSDERASIHCYPILGPYGWNGRILADPLSDIPPYPTTLTEDLDIGGFTYGLENEHEFIIPIEVYGNYTFRIENLGNSTIGITYTLGTPVITMETKPLGEYIYPRWLPTHAEERIARIRQLFVPAWPSQPSVSQPPQTTQDLSTAIHDTASTASNLVAVVIFSVTALAILTVFTISRKRA